jgi:predicted RNase H-like HicB family nuclease
MTTRYPIVVEAEESGAVGAYVPGLPIYAAADTASEAEEALRALLVLYVDDRQARGLALPEPLTGIKVARVTTVRGRSTVSILGPAAWLGRQRSAKKAAAARRNGRRGGRPAATGPRRPRQ